MGKITAIRSGKGKRVNIFLDGKFALSLETEVVAKEGLEPGQELSAQLIEALSTADSFHRCLKAAVLYLSYRPRSEAELTERLKRRGFDADTVVAVISRLKEQGVVNDGAFAQFWKDNRESFSPRSRFLTRLELKQKGVATDIIDQVVTTVDDEASAYQAALSKAHHLTRSNYQSFRRRLGDHLRRRGFGYEVINTTVKRLWQEQGELGGGELLTPIEKGGDKR